MRKILLLSYLLFSLHTFAQLALDSLIVKYPFVKVDSNFIYNDSIGLSGFLTDLKNLNKNHLTQLNVVHIGDSHIQADIFSGKMRTKLQEQFGNAGRGLIFPYRVAKTNEPIGFKTTTNAVWKAKRNVFVDNPLPIGVSGITIETGDSTAEIKLVVRNQPSLEYGFSKLTLYHAKDSTGFDFSVLDTLNNELAYINTLDNVNKFTSTVRFTEPQHKLILRSCPRNTSQNCARIYGMLLENEKPGILYNTIGVNGAEFRHYNESAYFIEQLNTLSPSLIIISLGTNEGVNRGFKSDEFYAHIDTLVTSIKMANPGASFLLTTPGDSFRKSRRGKQKNPEMLEARNVILKYSKEHNLACWDLYAIMGGYGSMAKWYTAKLTAKDKLHFNKKGYELQGELLFDALIKSFKR